jgi:hypothetical protein
MIGSMPCWPDIWDWIEHALPLLGDFALLLLYSALVVLLLWAPTVRRRQLRISFRVLGAIGLVPLAFVLVMLFVGIALNWSDPEIRVTKSMDGHQATLSYKAGFLGRDYTEITLQQPNCCRHTTVFYHFGPSSLEDTKLEWLDNRHLQITYHTRPDDLQHCDKQVGPVSVACSPQPWAWQSRTSQTPSAAPAQKGPTAF